MKRNILVFLMIIFSVTANAQNNKPTKEQTIEYIINTFKEYSSDYLREDGVSVSESITDVSFDNCLLTIKVTRDLVSVGRKYTPVYQLDLKTIEKIYLKETSKNIYLDFAAYNSNKTIKIISNSIKNGVQSAESTSYDSMASFSAPGNQKLVDAFNHLRKLCGAPEPITF